ncbi:uncharacterized protein ccdc142 [Astyanax mexicanus]|uniref:uncharacterized protein ccdc142 n=1 Tax=Astyanax mexicanus TaxID=7994 RepID=UPI0020CADC33|nr:uncharacterized protein ccdc142 [Astyanax mexicanus]
MAQMSANQQEGQSEPNKPPHSTAAAADRVEQSAVTDSSELLASEDEQRKPIVCPEILSEEYLSRDKYDGSRYHCPFTKSLQKAEALFRIRFNPSLKWLLRQKGDGSCWDYENEDNFVACQNLTSRSSMRLQRLEHNLLSLSSQCRVLRGVRGCLQGCVTGLSASGEADFYHHPQAAAFSQHYVQLQHLLEQRAQLLFLHEFGRRSRVASCFVTRLGDVLERARLLLLAGGGGPAAGLPSSSTWNLGLQAMCEELQLHVSHWDLLCARARSDLFLRPVLFNHSEMLGSMRKALSMLGLQALLLMERCIHTALLALAAAQLGRVPRDALEDLVAAVELYNHIVAQKKATTWSSQVLFRSNWSQISPGFSRNSAEPAPFPVVQLMKILARRRAQIASEQLYYWTSQQTDLISLSGQPSTEWSDSGPSDPPQPSSFTSASITAENSPDPLSDDPPKKHLHTSWSSNLPLSTFVRRDREYLETLFQVLVSSTDLLAPHIPKRPPLDRAHTADGAMDSSRRASEGEEKLPNRAKTASSRHKAIQWMDLSKSDACVELFSQYRDMLWNQFNRSVINCFYYQPHSDRLGSVNQWNYQMMFLLGKWLQHACKEELVPAESKDVLNKFCFHILSTAAFMRWDDMMCASLGLGVNDKCLPRPVPENSAVRTATMDLTIQLFPPLFCVLHLLQTPDPNSVGEEESGCSVYYLKLLRRAVATVQSSTFWVMSKAYQFLAAWALNKFLLVTQGDLKVLRRTVEVLAQQLDVVGDGAEHPLIVQHNLQLTRAVSQLQAFSELVLRIFSMDCKKMSVEIFEQTMPSAKHWRVNYKSELPSSPSEYAASAAQSVIGQVIEGVQPLPDEARIPALTEAMTAFMEAWMEHILKQKIKFSIQGALQLKQDFDLIRDLICSEEYSLSEELHHRLLSLRVFQQVDGAIVCLLQQPMAKTYVLSRGWDPFRRCCPKRGQVVDQAAGSLNNLETMDIQPMCHQALTQAEGSVTPELLSTAPPESYLAVAQQEWLDLRIHSGSRWRLPGFQCFSKSES